MTQQFGDVSVEIGDDFVAVVEIHRPPSNFFDVALIRSLAEAYAALDADPSCRAIVLCSEGKHFCAGADFSGQSEAEALPQEGAASLYREAVRLFGAETAGRGRGAGCRHRRRPGPGLFGGLPGGRARGPLRGQLRPARLPPRFGLTVTLPLIIGHQQALELLYTGRRMPGRRPTHRALRPAGRRWRRSGIGGRELAARSPPRAARDSSIRQTMRGHLADAVAAATDREDAEQIRLRATNDFAEGIRASAERRRPSSPGADRPGIR